MRRAGAAPAPTRAAARSTGPTSAACCRSTCTTTTRASRCGPSTGLTTRSSTATWTRTSRPCATSAERPTSRPGSRTTSLMGPVILARGLGDVPVRGEDPRLGARVHAQAALRSASRRTRARASCPRRRCWSARGTRPRACGRRCRSRACASAPSWARRASTCTPSCRASRTTAPAELDGARALARRARADRLRRRGRARRSTRSAIRGATSRPTARSWRQVRAGYDTTRHRRRRARRAGRARPAAGADRLLRREADRLEGRRPAARRLAAACWRGSPRAQAGVVGFGTYREGLEVLLRGLERADERLLMHVCRQGRALEGGPRDQLTYLRTFLEASPAATSAISPPPRRCASSIVFTGRLEHGELGAPAAGRRGGRRAEHVPRGVRDGRRRGRRLRRAAGLRRPLGPGGGGGDPRREAAAAGARSCSPSSAACARSRTSRRAMIELARAGRAAALVGRVRPWHAPRQTASAGSRSPRPSSAAAQGRTAVLEPVPGAVPFCRAAPSAQSSTQAAPISAAT